MESVCLRLEKSVVKEIELNMKEFKYSTKTELIRDALREKLKKFADEREKKKAWRALYAARGIFKGQGKAKTDEEFYKLREQAGKEIIEHYEKKFGINLKFLKD